MPYSLECLKIVGLIGWELENAQRLSDEEKQVAAELRSLVTYCLQQSHPLETLRQYAVSRVRAHEGLADRLVLLTEARAQALQRPAGKWLLGLLEELGCMFGLLTEEGQPPDTAGPVVAWAAGRRYADATLSPRLSRQEVGDFWPSLLAVVKVQDPPGVDLDLLQIRCTVLAAAVGLGKQVEAIGRLPGPDSPAPGDLVKAAALEVRWLVDGKAGRTGVLDRLAVVGKVTPKMFAVLLRDLDLDERASRDLFDWLRGGAEPQFAGVVDQADGEISLGNTVGSAIRSWLGEDDQAALRQQAQIAAERCYRECLLLDPEHVTGSGYGEWMADGYAGLTIFENPDLMAKVHIWCSHVAKIESPEGRVDSGIAITCLFLEAWWWWGDQLRLPTVVEILNLAKEILRDQPGWIDALEEFNANYVPELDRPAGAADNWRHVAHALDVLAGCLELRPGSVPPDRILARIHVCWCFFNGDAAQYTGDLEAADGWFRQAAEACGDDDDKAKRAFANYQRADVWIPSDTDRSMRVITETDLAAVAVALDDQSLRAYTARMYGDIRWQSGNVDGAFDAYGRALLLSYIYQVDQESAIMPPSEYTFRLYTEMRTRFLARLDQARGKGLESAADAAIERITMLFGPYWGRAETATVSGEDRLAGIVPPLPTDLQCDSGYVKDALQLKVTLGEQIAEPVDQPLPRPNKGPDPY